MFVTQSLHSPIQRFAVWTALREGQPTQKWFLLLLSLVKRERCLLLQYWQRTKWTPLSTGNHQEVATALRSWPNLTNFINGILRYSQNAQFVLIIFAELKKKVKFLEITPMEHNTCSKAK